MVSQHPKATTSREKTPPVTITSNSEAQDFDMIANTGSMPRSDDNREQTSARRSESPRTRVEMFESDSNRSRRVARGEETRNMETGMKDQPRSSVRDGRSPREYETDGRRSRGSSIREEPRRLDEPIFVQSTREFLTPKGKNSAGNSVPRVRETWGWPTMAEATRDKGKDPETRPETLSIPWMLPGSSKNLLSAHTRQETQRGARDEMVRSAVGRMRLEVDEVNNAFDESMEFMRKGAEISRKAAVRRAALNKEFNDFLELLTIEESPEGADKRPKRSASETDAHEEDARKTLKEIAEMNRRTADFARREKAGLLNPQEAAEIAREVKPILPRRIREVRREHSSSEKESSADESTVPQRATSRHRQVRTTTIPIVGTIGATYNRYTRTAETERRASRTPVTRDAIVGGSRVLVMPERFRSHGASHASADGVGERGNRVERLVDDMFRTSTIRKSGEGPKLAKMGIKLPLPEPYDGSANIDVFENWLVQVINWMQMYELDADTAHVDLLRVQILSQTLKGRASVFYQNRLEEACEASKNITFREMVLELQERFLHKATALEAAQKFENVTQGSRDTQALMEELRKYAARMVEPPSDYQMKRRFMYAMRKDISSWVISMGHNPERSTLRELIETARYHEESQLYQRGFQSVREPQTMHRHASVEIKGKAPMRTASRVPGNFRHNSQEHQGRGTVLREDLQNAKASSSGQRPPIMRSRTPQQSDKPKEKTPGNAQMNIICFHCNKKGHYATKCPEKIGVQGYALDIIAEDDQGENSQEMPKDSSEVEGAKAEDQQEEQEETPEGAQYDPEDHQEQYRFSELSEEEVECRMIHVYPIEGLEKDGAPQLMAAHVPERDGVPPQNSTIRRKVGFIDPQPKREAKYQQTINVLLNVGGIMANVLFDTGCTTEALSPEFARVAGLRPLELTQQMGLALAVKGSSSKLNFGTWADVTVGPIRNTTTYFDIINIDRYDAILGTPFMWKHSISPIFEDGGYLLHKGKRLDVPIKVVNRPVNRELTNKEGRDRSFRTNQPFRTFSQPRA
jgi:hypothetical protein